MFFARRKPYAERSARQKSLIYIRLKNKIRRAAPFLGGLFHSRDYFSGGNSWVDVHFIGKDRTPYHAVIRTARYAYKDLVEDAAWDASEKLVPDTRRLVFGPLSWVTGLGRVDIVQETDLSAFGGLTRLQWIAEESGRIADGGTISVQERVRFDRSFPRAVGLSVILNVPRITVDVVNEFIRSFIAGGEKESQGATLTFTNAEVGNWNLESNYIVDPCEHPPSE